MSVTRSHRTAASAVSSATSVPDPIAIPTLACFRADASLIPSQTYRQTSFAS